MTDKVTIQRFFIKTSVNAIKVLKNVILIGTGGFLIIYDRFCEKVVSKIFIFNETITGIDFEDNLILIYAENVLGVFKLKENSEITELNRFYYNDWILTSKFIENGIVSISIHSEAINLDRNLNVLTSSKSTEICTCYCAHIINKNWDDLFVLSGTAFSEIFIWKPSVKVNDKCEILYKIIGHKGVIFSIDYSEKLGLICSTSDDGKAMIWNAKDFFINKNRIICVKELQHRQRVFKGKFFNNHLITTLEDSTIKIWDANFENKTSSHQIGPIWSLDFCEEMNLVFSGGADGGVVSTPINFQLDQNKSNNILCVNNKNRYKDFVVLSHKIGVGITNIGEFNLINTHELIEKHSDLNSYCLVRKSPCKRLICLAGMRGNLHLYQLKGDEIVYKISCNIKDNPKIFSLHWLTCKSFLVCLNDGILILWYFNDKELVPTQFFQLPPLKERWSTSATFCRDHLIVGDRKGNLFIFEIKTGHLVEILKKIQPNGVTQLYFNQDKQELIVLGRNSIFQKFTFTPSNLNRLNLIIKDKLPFSWLGAYELLNGKEIILGFSTDKFVIYNQTRRRIILEVNCGGGHRLWDYHLANNHFTLTYQKINKLISIKFNLESEIKNVLESFHGTETNSMKLIVIKLTPFTCFCISGGEDTTLRLSKINFKDELNGFEVVNVIKSHLSSIRVVIYHQINPKEYFVYSGGGRAQIILWGLNISGENVIFKELFSYYKELDEFESEIRIMDLTTIEFNNKIVLFSACSNGDIKIYETNLTNPEIKYLFKISHKNRCILKLFTITFGDVSFLVSTSTDGCVNFFNISNLENIDNSFVSEFKTNQSGINSVSFCYLDDNKAVILTGGDDKAFSLNLIEYNKGTINRLSYYSNENHHFAHITGAFITKSHFITASIDQKVIVYRWGLTNNQFEVEEVCKKFTHITDLQGIDYVFDGDELKLVLFGNGFEIFSVNLE